MSKVEGRAVVISLCLCAGLLLSFFTVPAMANQPSKTADDVLIEIIPYRIFTVSEPEDCEWGSGLLDCVNEYEEIEEATPLYIRNGDLVEIDLETYANAFINSTSTPDNEEIYVAQDESEIPYCHRMLYGPGDTPRKQEGEGITTPLEYDNWWGVVWQGTGVYEVDIYASCPPDVSFKTPSLVDKLLAVITPKVALAHWFNEEFADTFQFTVVDSNDQPECCSSVLFLPGIMGTELFEGVDKRWEPGSESDVERLYLNEAGKSLNDITVGDVIDTFDGPSILNANLYESFLEDLEVKKQQNFIDNYAAYGYDWRLSLPDILASGDLENKIRELANASKSKKVTIVAHSNGGLLAKALINELGNEAAGLVDQIILVGVPQLGTPQAIGSLLHGYDSGIPTFYSDVRARDFARNSPFTYNLLPHDSYSNNAGVSVSTPLITFGEGEATQAFVDTYGSEIYSGNKLRDYILGTDGRSVPAYDNLVSPTKGNETLLQNTISQQASVGHLWQPPEGITIHQIGGVGELTVAGIEYQTIRLCLSVINSATGWYCNTGTKTLGYKPIRVLDGDATVVEPSALAMQENENVKRWWVNLAEYNKIFFGQVTQPIFRTEHKDLLEIPEMRELIWDTLIGTSTAMNYQFISVTKPELGSDKRLTFTLHSPLSLSYTENDGTVIDETNPYGKHSKYTRYGEVQIIDIYTDEPGTIEMQGEKTGSFTLEVEESEGGEVTSTFTYAGIPSSTSTIATLEIEGTSIEDTAPLKVDYDGNGETDFMLEPVVGETVTLPEELPPEPTIEELVIQFKTYVNDNVTNKSVKKSLVKQIDQFYKQYQQQEKLKSKSPFFAKLLQNNFVLRLRLQTLERQIDMYVGWKRVTLETAEELKGLISLMINKL